MNPMETPTGNEKEKEMESDNKEDSLDNALKIMNNLFLLTEEFVHDNPNGRNKKDLKSGTSAEEKTVPSTEDKPTTGITFPELPDPDQFLESIISSKINSESSDDTPGNSADPKDITIQSPPAAQSTIPSNTTTTTPIPFPQVIPKTTLTLPVIPNLAPDPSLGSISYRDNTLSAYSTNITLLNKSHVTSINPKLALYIEKNSQIMNFIEKIKSGGSDVDPKADSETEKTTHTQDEQTNAIDGGERPPKALGSQLNQTQGNNRMPHKITKEMTIVGEVKALTRSQKRRQRQQASDRRKERIRIQKEKKLRKQQSQKESGDTNESETNPKDKTGENTIKLNNLENSDENGPVNTNTEQDPVLETGLPNVDRNREELQPNDIPNKITQRSNPPQNKSQNTILTNRKKICIPLGKQTNIEEKNTDEPEIILEASERDLNISATIDTPNKEDEIVEMTNIGEVKALTRNQKRRRRQQASDRRKERIRIQKEKKLRKQQSQKESGDTNESETNPKDETGENTIKLNNLENSDENGPVNTNTEQDPVVETGLPNVDRNREELQPNDIPNKTIQRSNPPQNKSQNRNLTNRKKICIPLGKQTNIEEKNTDEPEIILEASERDLNISATVDTLNEEDDEIVELEVPPKVFPLIDILSDDEDKVTDVAIIKDVPRECEVIDENSECKEAFADTSIGVRNVGNSVVVGGNVKNGAIGSGNDPKSVLKSLPISANSSKSVTPSASLPTSVPASSNSENTKGDSFEKGLKRKNEETVDIREKKRKGTGDNETLGMPSDKTSGALRGNYESSESCETDVNGEKTKGNTESTKSCDMDVIDETRGSGEIVTGVEIVSATPTRISETPTEMGKTGSGVLETPTKMGKTGSGETPQPMVSDQERIQGVAILNLINEVKMSTRQQRKQNDPPTLSSHSEDPPTQPTGKPSIRDRLGDKLSVKDRIGPVDSGRLTTGGSSIRDRLGGKVEEEMGGGIRVHIENELVTGDVIRTDLGMASILDSSLPIQQEEEEGTFIRQVRIEPPDPASCISADSRLSPKYREEEFPFRGDPNYRDDREKAKFAEFRAGPTVTENPYGADPRVGEECRDLPMMDEDGFQTLSEAESYEEDSTRQRKRRSAKDRLGERVLSSDEEGSIARRRRHSDSRNRSRHARSRRRSRSPRRAERSRRDSNSRSPRGRVRDRSSERVRDRLRSRSPRGRVRDRSSGRVCDGLRLRSPRGRRRDRSSGVRDRRCERERRDSGDSRHQPYQQEFSRSRGGRYQGPRPPYQSNFGPQFGPYFPPGGGAPFGAPGFGPPGFCQPGFYPGSRPFGPPPAPARSNLIELVSSGSQGGPGPIMEHQIPGSFLEPTSMPMDGAAPYPGVPIYSEPPPAFTQPPPVFNNPPPLMDVQMVPPDTLVPTLVPPPTLPIPHTAPSTDPTDPNFTFMFIEQNISKVQSNLMNKIDKSRSKVDEYFEKWKKDHQSKSRSKSPRRKSTSRSKSRHKGRSESRSRSREPRRPSRGEVRSPSHETSRARDLSPGRLFEAEARASRSGPHYSRGERSRSPPNFADSRSPSPARRAPLSPELFSSRADLMTRGRTPSPPSPPRYRRSPTPVKVNIQLSPLRFSRSPSLEVIEHRRRSLSPPRRLSPPRHLSPPRRLSPLRRLSPSWRLSPPRRRPSPLHFDLPMPTIERSPSPHLLQLGSFSRSSPHHVTSRNRYHGNVDALQSRDTRYHGNTDALQRYHSNHGKTDALESRDNRYHGKTDAIKSRDTRYHANTDALERYHGIEDARLSISQHRVRMRSPSFSLSPSPPRRGRFSPPRSHYSPPRGEYSRRGGASPTRSSSSEFGNPLDLIENPGIPGEEDFP
ncbi:hypothetical protein M8J76_005332 [Diaphorina citri]|nr:hypothetical protein M8J76_005332 [Diaphorina citri]